MKAHSNPEAEEHRMTLIDHTRRYVVDTDLASLAHLAAEGLQRRQIAAAFTFTAREGSPSKTLQKQAAEGLAARITTAQMPLVCTPESILAALKQLGVHVGLAQVAVDRLVASRSVIEERDQPNGRAACDLLMMYLNAAGTGLHAAVRPASEPGLDEHAELGTRTAGHVDTPAAEVVLPHAENSVAEGAYPDAVLAAVTDGGES
jgi:hypothetical protein